MLSDDGLSTTNQSAALSILLPLLHDPFMKLSTEFSEGANSSANDSTPLKFTPHKAIMTLITILTNADPSPALINFLITPIVMPLYNIFEAVSNHKTVDPAIKMTVSGLLTTWARISDKAIVVGAIWHIVQDNEAPFVWQIDIAGELSLVEK